MANRAPAAGMVATWTEDLIGKISSRGVSTHGHSGEDTAEGPSRGMTFSEHGC